MEIMEPKRIGSNKRQRDEVSSNDAVDKRFKTDKNVRTPWSQGLVASMADPQLILSSDSTAVIIKDKYPKAKHHYLIIPRANIPDLKSLTVKNIDLLKHLELMAKNLISSTSLPRNVFKVGYHAVPSMHRLHLHVISKDFISKCLKTRQHWNSFNTDYFISAEDVESALIENGTLSHVTVGKEKLLSTPLKCHVCDTFPKTMPQLKLHILNHEKQFM